MEKGKRDQEKRGNWRALGLLGLGLVPCSVLLSLSGCLGDRRASSDPLLGDRSPRPTGGAAAVPPAQAAATPPPVPGSLTSNAALASTTGRPLDGSSELRIGAMPTTASPANWQGQGTPVATQVHQPVAAFEAASQPPILARGVAPVSSVRVISIDQALSRLAGYGVKGMRLETWGDNGEWKFSCSIPNRQNQYISRNYESRAGDSLSALRSVIEQIEKEQPH